ncbi:bifunctional DNA primase/polymerase [Streptomyces rubradiris]|uniref:bifunctional DNA primase/polymerase n=1 Tax=Streptomyces rubradiris TaxID=285531 RepID=UPI001E4D1582|nr:bifunctional DNA primase/polymerase [Streptomyces rubradiris]
MEEATSTDAEPVAVALWCVRRGWPVLPLLPGRKTPAGNCPDCRGSSHPPAQCACPGLGRWCHGFHAATLDLDRVRRWWAAQPGFGVGVSCGPAGLVVVDVDAHPAPPPARERVLPGIPIGDQVDLTGLANGFHTLGVLAALHGKTPPDKDTTTLRVRTPSGGMHVWYRSNRRWQSSVGSGTGRSLAWQVDIRAHGSYIVAPGTRVGATSYTPLGAVRDPAPLPGWLAWELERTGHLPPAGPASRPVPPRAPRAVAADGTGLLAGILEPVRACGRFEENAGFSDALNRAAYTLGGLLAAGRLPSGAERLLRETALEARPGQQRRIDGIIRSGLAAGRRRPLHDSGRLP